MTKDSIKKKCSTAQWTRTTLDDETTSANAMGLTWITAVFFYKK